MNDIEHKKKVNELLTEAMKQNESRSMYFCPLSKEMCRIDCSCYVLAQVHNVLPEVSHVHGGTYEPYMTGGYCNCYTLHGPS